MEQTKPTKQTKEHFDEFTIVDKDDEIILQVYKIKAHEKYYTISEDELDEPEKYKDNDFDTEIECGLCPMITVKYAIGAMHQKGNKLEDYNLCIYPNFLDNIYELNATDEVKDRLIFDTLEEAIKGAREIKERLKKGVAFKVTGW